MSRVSDWTGDELREKRTILGLTQEQLAARLGVTERTVRRWENGQWPIPSIAEHAVKQFLTVAAFKAQGVSIG